MSQHITLNNADVPEAILDYHARYNEIVLAAGSKVILRISIHYLILNIQFKNIILGMRPWLSKRYARRKMERYLCERRA